MKIERIGTFKQRHHVVPGDVFRLVIDGEYVHQVEITRIQVITCWALVRLDGSGLGYFVGNDTLIPELERLVGRLSRSVS